nr:PilC/PilY family type IV pilus protein [Rhodoferax sp.]
MQALACVLLPLLVVSAAVVHAQTPAQLPLLTKAGAAVAPNVMLTLDDSGSMQWRHMPETVFAGGTFLTPNPVSSRGVFWDKNDNYMNTQSPFGTVPGNIASANFNLRALRSADTNTIYYNPEIWYKPWLTSNGVTRLPDSPINVAGQKVYKDPLVLTGAAGTYIDLTAVSPMGSYLAGSFVVGYTYTILTSGTTNFTLIGAANNNVGTTFVATGVGSGTGTAGGALTGWCFANIANPDCASTTPTFLHDPGVYFRLKLNVAAGAFVVGKSYTIAKLGSTNFVALGATANTVGLTFTTTGVGTGTGVAHEAVNTAGNYIGYSINSAPAGSFVVGAQYQITSTGTTSFTSIGSGSNAVGTVFTATGVGSGTGVAKQIAFTKYPDRLDCAGATCTQTEERQNFANWFSYYRNRNLLARGGLMESFGVEAAPVNAGNFVIGSSYAITSVGTTSFTAIGASANTVDTVFTASGVGTGTGTARAIAMRLGFGRINNGFTAVDGVGTNVIEGNAIYGGGGVRDFNFARKANLFKWLENLPANGGTPLVGALEANGVYYSRQDTQGPWTDNPAVSTNIVANNKTCRRSYTFITTDGYWTTAGTAGNADNTVATTINSSIVPPALLPAYPPYTYTPVAPYNDSWSNTLADTAMKYWVTDLQPATKNLVPPVGNNVSFWQNMTTFTIGLGVRGTLDPATDLPALTAGTKVWPQATPGGTAANIDDLWHAAVNSRGQFFSVKDPQELALAIRTALARATGGTGSTAGVAAASSTLTGNNRKYKLEFDPGSWNGEITSLGPNPAPPNLLNVPMWTASTQMTALTPWNTRNIVTFDSTPGTWAGTAFNLASIPATGLAAMGPVAALNPLEFINFLKGDHTNEGTSGLGIYRQRISAAGQPFILGDFVNSNPSLIWSNFDGVYTDTAWGGSAAYSAFKVTKAARTPVLFAGSNDGMLHAFKDSLGVTPATDGQEVFAYVPRAVYGNLDKLASKNYGTTAALPHQYFVDGPLAEADAYVRAPSASTATWRNYLMGTLGSGGRAVFALDVTDTANLNASSVRWELSSADDPDIGYVLSNVRIGVLPNGRWVAVFGNGYGSTSGNAVLFVVDLEDAASSSASVRASAIHKTVLDSTGSNGLGGVTLIHDIATGRTSNIYVGDLKGNLWKLDYTPPTGVPVPGSPLFAANGGAAFFTATDSVGVAQPITSSPAVFKGPTSQGYKGYMVVFGTGKLFSTADATSTSPQSMYSVWDKKAGPTPLTETVSRPMSRTNLVARTLSAFGGTGPAAGTVFYSVTGAAVDYNSAQRGFYIDLNPVMTGGRVVYPSQVLGFSTALVSAVAPVQGTPQACDSSFGVGLNLTLPVDTGTDTTGPSFDTNGDGAVNGSDSTASGYGTKADGGDVSVSSQGVNGNPRADTGGGGPVGDCTGDACAKTKCVKSSYCGAKRCLVILENSTGSQMSCPLEFPDGTRIWRRIINNVPIR